MFSCLPARTTSVAGTVSGTQKNFSDFVQKHFVSATNVSQFAKPKKHGQQCVRNNVSSFTRALSYVLLPAMPRICALSYEVAFCLLK